jgi:hypothetical protein
MTEAKENEKTKLVEGNEPEKEGAPSSGNGTESEESKSESGGRMPAAVEPKAASDAPVELPSNADTVAEVNPRAVDSVAPEPSPYATPPLTESDEMQGVMIALVIVLSIAILYVGLTVFREDSLVFFSGIFVFLAVRPGSIIKAKSKMTLFVKELAMAFLTCFCLFLVIKAVMPPGTTTDDQAKYLTMVLWALGVRLVFFPYYNLDDPKGINK